MGGSRRPAIYMFRKSSEACSHEVQIYVKHLERKLTLMMTWGFSVLRCGADILGTTKLMHAKQSLNIINVKWSNGSKKKRKEKKKKRKKKGVKSSNQEQINGSISKTFLWFQLWCEEFGISVKLLNGPFTHKYLPEANISKHLFFLFLLLFLTAFAREFVKHSLPLHLPPLPPPPPQEIRKYCPSA